MISGADFDVTFAYECQAQYVGGPQQVLGLTDSGRAAERAPTRVSKFPTPRDYSSLSHVWPIFRLEGDMCLVGSSMGLSTKEGDFTGRYNLPP